jgi:hypothetical protein
MIKIQDLLKYGTMAGDFVNHFSKTAVKFITKHSDIDYVIAEVSTSTDSLEKNKITNMCVKWKDIENLDNLSNTFSDLVDKCDLVDKFKGSLRPECMNNLNGWDLFESE